MISRFRDIVFLLEFNADGRMERYASRTCSFNGHNYIGGLDFSFSWGGNLDASSPSLPDITVSVPASLDISKFRSEGHSLAGAELSYKVSNISDRIVLGSGIMDRVVYDSLGEKLTFSISTLSKNEILYPSANALVSQSSWGVFGGTLPTQNEGLVYPTIIGRPGYNPERRVGYYASRAYLIGYGAAPSPVGLLLVAGHRLGANYDITPGQWDGSLGGAVTGGATGKYVYIFDEVNGAGSVREIHHIKDGLGRVCACVLTDAASSGGPLDPGPEMDHTYLISWSDPTLAISDDDIAYGIRDPFRGRRLSNPAAVFEWVYGDAVDFVRNAPAHRALRNISCNLPIVERGNMDAWFRRYIMPLLPVTLARSHSGIFLSVWNISPLVLRQGDNCWRDGHLEDLDRPTISKSIVRFCRRISNYGEWPLEASSLNEAEVDMKSKEIVLNAYPLTSAAAASWVARWKIRARQLHGKRARYIASWNLFDHHFIPGASVVLIDESRGIQATTAVIERIHLSPPGIAFDLIY